MSWWLTSCDWSHMTHWHNRMVNVWTIYIGVCGRAGWPSSRQICHSIIWGLFGCNWLLIASYKEFASVIWLLHLSPPHKTAINFHTILHPMSDIKVDGFKVTEYANSWWYLCLLAWNTPPGLRHFRRPSHCIRRFHRCTAKSTSTESVYLESQALLLV